MEHVLGNGSVPISRKASSSEYSSALVRYGQPSFNSVIRVMEGIRGKGGQFLAPDKTEATLVAIGKLGSSGGIITGIAIDASLQDVINAQHSSGTYQERLTALFNGHTTFVSVVNIIVRPL